MTTIIASRKDRRIMADSRACLGSDVFDCVTKLYTLPDGAIFGAAGEVDAIYKAVAFLRGERNRPKKLNMTGLVVRPDGVYVMDAYCTLVECSSPFFAVGSGAHLAMGAMAAGADMTAAMKIAMRFDTGTGGKINSISLPK